MNSILKKILIFVLAMALIGVAGWFGRKAYKRSSERRMVAQARECLQKNDWKNASICLQRALRANPFAVEPCELMADALDSVGSPGALDLRLRVEQIQPSDQHRFAWAETALRLREFPSALEALTGVQGAGTNTAQFHKLAGALEWELNRPVEAEKHYIQALRLDPTNSFVQINLATVHLASTDTNVANSARASLEQMTTNPAVRLVALRRLIADAESRNAIAKALSYSKILLADPKAGLGDKIEHLQLLRVSKSPEADSYLSSLKEASKKSPEEAFALGRWMTMAMTPSDALHWLQTLPKTIQTNQPVLLVTTDCLVATKDWKGLVAATSGQDWNELDYYRISLVALAQRSLDQTLSSQNSWHKALRLVGHRLDRLTRLAQITEAWGWNNERREVLWEIAGSFPKTQWATEQLTAQLYLAGDTRGMQELLSKLLVSDPSNVHLKNNLANVCLLRKTEEEKAFRWAKEAYESSPTDPYCISTYAYALLLRDKRPEALKMLENIKPEHLKVPVIAAYYGIVQAQAGRKDAAKGPLALAETAKLLPEEKELIRLAKARL